MWTEFSLMSANLKVCNIIMKRLELEQLKEQYEELNKEYKILYSNYLHILKINRLLNEKVIFLKRRMEREKLEFITKKESK